MIKKIGIIVSILVSANAYAMRAPIRCQPSKLNYTYVHAHTVVQRYSGYSKGDQQQAWEDIVNRVRKKVNYYEKRKQEHEQIAKQHEKYAKICMQLAVIEVAEISNLQRAVGQLNEALFDPFAEPSGFDELEINMEALRKKKLKLESELPNDKC